MLHISLLVILLGAGITWFTAEQGSLSLQKGNSYYTFADSQGHQYRLPFAVALDQFQVIPYPGTQTPMDFESHLVIRETDTSNPILGKVAMNHIFSHRGYRFYQSGYNPEDNSSTLSVSHDPWGIVCTYLGYCLLLVSIVWYLFSSRSRLRTLVGQARRASRGGLLLVACTLSLAHQAQSAPSARTIPQNVANDLGDLYILHNGRICPFDTFAREFTLKLYGRSSYRGLSAEQVVAEWLFYFDDWCQEPLFKISNSEVRQLLQIQGKYATWDDFISPNGAHKIDEIQKKLFDNTSLSDKRAWQEALEKFEIASMLASSTTLKIMPIASKDGVQWYAPSDNDLPHNIDDHQWTFVRQGINYLHELVIKQDWSSARLFLAKLKQFQKKECGSEILSEPRFVAEKGYNRLVGLSGLIAKTIASCGIAFFIFVAMCKARSRRLSPKLLVASRMLVVILFAYLTTAIALRWVVCGHIPLSNGFETMQFMAWVSLLFTLLVGKKTSLILPFGILLAGLTLLVSHLGASNPQISPLMPVLQSPLLSLHVFVIMTAYTLLAFIMLNSCMALVLRRQRESVYRLYLLSQILLYPAIFLFAIGIFVGAVWANVSWGTYWNWDPKEVWALITLIIYALALHAQSLPRFQKPMFFHLYTLIAFVCVLVTYFGVNFVLGGMHSYA